MDFLQKGNMEMLIIAVVLIGFFAFMAVTDAAKYSYVSLFPAVLFTTVFLILVFVLLKDSGVF